MTFIRRAYFKVTCPQIAYDTFEELIQAHPECSVDCIELGAYVPYKCMNHADWEIWMHTGVMPHAMGIV